MSGLLILTEAGNDIGFGHFTRCSAIQEFCLNAGTKTKMLLDLKGNYDIRPKSGEIADWITNKELVRKNWEVFSTVLIDSYLAQTDYYDFLSETFEKVIAMDDYNRINYSADLILNPNLAFYDIDYKNQKARIVGGEDYVILREVFRSRIDQKPLVRENVEKVVITLGGGDLRGLLPILTPLILPFCRDLEVITGNNELKKLLQQKFENVHFTGYLSGEQMYTVFSGSDIVISACGQTLHELASMGKSVIGICLDHDQEPNMNYYYKKGFLNDKIYWNDPSLHTKIISIFEGLQKMSTRLEKRELATGLINAKGLQNIYNVIID